MNKKWQIALIWLGGIAVVVLIVMVGMKNSVERKMVEDQVAEVEDNHIDAEAFYQENSDVKNVIEVEKSSTTQTEKQIIEEIDDRGFENIDIYTDYGIDGEYLNGVKIDGSNDKHPSYQMTYISANDELWTIIVQNGCIMANPVSFNAESELGVQLIIAESEVISCYDSQTNMFYETIPNETELVVKVVDRIDAETLDRLTVEVIKEL